MGTNRKSKCGDPRRCWGRSLLNRPCQKMRKIYAPTNGLCWSDRIDRDERPTTRSGNCRRECAIRWLPKEYSSRGGGIEVRFPRTRSLSGKYRFRSMPSPVPPIPRPSSRCALRKTARPSTAEAPISILLWWRAGLCARAQHTFGNARKDHTRGAFRVKTMMMTTNVTYTSMV